jgi:hypothetical protein
VHGPVKPYTSGPAASGDAGLLEAFVERANAKQLNAGCLTQVTRPFPT